MKTYRMHLLLTLILFVSALQLASPALASLSRSAPDSAPSAIHPTAARATSNTSPARLAAPADASQPADEFQMIGSIGGRVKTITVSGSLAYASEGQGLTVLDISNPAKPRRVNRLLLDRLYAVQAQHQFLYGLSERGLQIIDITAPLSPTLRGFYPLTGAPEGFPFDETTSPRALKVVNTTVYVAAGDGLHILDVSNADQPS